MSRTANTNSIEQFPEDADFSTMSDAVKHLDTINIEAGENAVAVARQVGYSGALTVGALEDEIRFYQRRSVEACIELGKRLLVLKELAPHGEFTQRAELLGFSPRMAQKFMAATLKFSNANSSSLLKATGTQSKMLELLVLDDGEIEALESGNTVRGLTLDKIETLSVSELKKALREAELDKQAKDMVIADKTAQLNKQAEQLVKRAHVEWPEAFEGYLKQLAITRKNLKHAIGSLAIISKDAMQIEPQSEAEEASLNQAREILATELVGIHNECLEMIQALGLQFDRSLGAYSDARIALLSQ